jgi:dsRNA-specific ribonuclease
MDETRIKLFLALCAGLTEQQKHRLARQYIELVFTKEMTTPLAQFEKRPIPAALMEQVYQVGGQACILAGFEAARDNMFEYDDLPVHYNAEGWAQVETESEERAAFENYLNLEAAGDAIWDAATAIILKDYYQDSLIKSLLAPWQAAGIDLKIQML